MNILILLFSFCMGMLIGKIISWWEERKINKKWEKFDQQHPFFEPKIFEPKIFEKEEK